MLTLKQWYESLSVTLALKQYESLGVTLTLKANFADVDLPDQIKQ